jgi:hypothetical protein
MPKVLITSRYFAVAWSVKMPWRRRYARDDWRAQDWMCFTRSRGSIIVSGLGQWCALATSGGLFAGGLREAGVLAAQGVRRCSRKNAQTLLS